MGTLCAGKGCKLDSQARKSDRPKLMYNLHEKNGDMLSKRCCSVSSNTQQKLDVPP